MQWGTWLMIRNSWGYFSGVFSRTFISQNTTKAITRKSIREPTKRPTAKTTGPTLQTASSQPPPGMKKVITGIIMSETRADTSFPAAPPIMKAMARPTMPYLDRKDLNSSTSPSGWGGGAAGLAASDSLMAFSSDSISLNTSSLTENTKVLMDFTVNNHIVG